MSAGEARTGSLAACNFSIFGATVCQATRDAPAQENDVVRFALADVRGVFALPFGGFRFFLFLQPLAIRLRRLDAGASPLGGDRLIAA